MAYISFQPKDFFNTKLYTGTGASNAQTGVDFQPDMTWLKSRSAATAHYLFDAVRGATKAMFPSSTDVEATNAEYLKSFDSDGFTVGTNAGINDNTVTYVGWNWKANGAGSSNEDGGINTTATSANATSGVSICTWTGTGSASSIGHGLGVAPEWIVVKSTSNAYKWYVWQKSYSDEMNIYNHLDTTAAGTTDTSAFGSTAPTSTVFPIGTGNAGTNTSGHTYLAYCFASIKGFSKVGMYKGNTGTTTGAPFIYTGFRPGLVIIKARGQTTNWIISDSKRLGYNVDNNPLYTDVDVAAGTANNLDLLSNGFKIRNGSGSGSVNEINTNGEIYSYIAFAEFPIVSSNSKSGTAR
jgi:hypothetical protein